MTDTVKENKLLDVQGLKTSFLTHEGTITVVDGVSFSIKPGETLGVVGESGCGKSVTALSIMRLIMRPAGFISGGSIYFKGKDLVKESEAVMRSIRGDDIAMIFQEPMTSLNPLFTVGDQIAEAVKVHRGVTYQEAFARAVEMLNAVKMPRSSDRANDYPHQLSGGMRQRAMIAMALSCNPTLLIADEPTTALDVTIQAQILALMKQLKDEFGMSILVITHDLGVIAEMVDRVLVMYAGEVMETAAVKDFFSNPCHPYSQGLLKSMPILNPVKTVRSKLHVIKGTVPNPAAFPDGCRFHPRCPSVEPRCREEEPPLFNLGTSMVKCWLYENGLKEGAVI